MAVDALPHASASDYQSSMRLSKPVTRPLKNQLRLLQLTYLAGAISLTSLIGSAGALAVNRATSQRGRRSAGGDLYIQQED